jgi:ABC-type transport system involved in cytochrome c biogenesis ATPase subunit
MAVNRIDRLTATDRMHHFNLITFAQGSGDMLAARNDVQIEFDRDSPPRQLEAGQQRRDGFAVWQFVGFTVQLNAHAGWQPSF